VHLLVLAEARRLNETLSSLEGTGHVISAIDLIDADQTADWIKSIVIEYGTLSGIFHSAGVELIRPIRMTKQAQLNDLFGNSLFAAFGIARAASQKNTITDGGSLVFMSSVAGSTGQQGMTAYSAAKAGIDALVRSLACEMAIRKIRVNSIIAGAVKTAMHERWFNGSSKSAIEEYEKSHLLGFGEIGDVSNAAVFLLSPAAHWITGTSLVVDGGHMVKR
jgi:NAD(P)-dependent dehydrogenase (short-subunit alcohol dehydrogenase family)